MPNKKQSPLLVALDCRVVFCDWVDLLGSCFRPEPIPPAVGYVSDMTPAAI